MYQLLKLPPYLGKGRYVLGEGEISRVYAVDNESAVPADAVAGVIMSTVFGPIVVGGSYGTTGHQGVRGADVHALDAYPVRRAAARKGRMNLLLQAT